MKLTQEEIRRIARREMRGMTRGGSSYVGGGVSEAWIAENFVSKDFFNRILTIHAEGSDVILPNDTETAIESIEAKAGLWTEQFISTLGMGDGGGGGGVTMLSLLDDVLINEDTLADGQALVYNATNQMWVNGTAGIDSIRMWELLSSPSADQIDPSHLSTALSDYLPLTGGTMKSTAVVSNLNADMLDGFHASSLFTSLSCSTAGTLSVTIGGISKQATVYAYNSDMLDSYHASSLFEGFSNNGDMVNIQIGSTSKSLTVDYASRAGKLNTGSNTYTAWGQTYWSNGLPVTINGDISNTGHIKPSSDITYDVGTDRLRYDNIYARFVRAYGTAPAVFAGVSESYFTALHYNSTNNYRGIYDKYQNTEGWVLRFDGTDTYLLRGTTKVSRLQIGSIVIEEDTVNSGLRIVGAGLYADTYISSLGVSSSGSSGGASSLSLLDDVSLSNPANGQSLVYRNGMWVNETVSGGGSTGVTALSQLSDTSIGTLYSGQLLRYNGTAWVNSYLALGDLSNVSLSSLSSGQFLMYSGYYWVNASIGVKISSTTTVNANSSGVIDLSTQGFLPLSGGTMTGRLITSDLGTINNASAVTQSTSALYCQGSAYFGKDVKFYYETYFSDDISQGTSYSASFGNVSANSLTVNGLITAKAERENGIQIGDWRIWGPQTNPQTLNFTSSQGEDVFIDGNWISQSDVRLKDIKRYVQPDIELFGRAPLFVFSWKNKANKREHIGTSAQYWRAVEPLLTGEDEEGFLRFDYTTAAFAGAITAAREIIRLKERVAELEKTINELKAA